MVSPARARAAGGLLLLLALWLAYSAGRREGKRSERLSCSVSGADRREVFVLAVNLKFKSVEDRDRLLKAWRPLAHHTKQQEPGALSYKWLVADDDPTKVLVYERYTSKDDYTGPHKSSEAFYAFKAAQSQIEMEITGQSYIETEDGFM